MSISRFKGYWVLLLAGIIFVFVDFRITTGMMLGFVCSVVHYKLIEIQFQQICQRETGGLFSYGNFFIRMLLLGFPLLISCLFPAVMHWAGVLVGFLYNKFSLFYRHIRSSISKG